MLCSVSANISSISPLYCDWLPGESQTDCCYVIAWSGTRGSQRSQEHQYAMQSSIACSLWHAPFGARQCPHDRPFPFSAAASLRTRQENIQHNMRLGISQCTQSTRPVRFQEHQFALVKGSERLSKPANIAGMAILLRHKLAGRGDDMYEQMLPYY